MDEMLKKTQQMYIRNLTEANVQRACIDELTQKLENIQELLFKIYGELTPKKPVCNDEIKPDAIPDVFLSSVYSLITSAYNVERKDQEPLKAILERLGKQKAYQYYTKLMQVYPQGSTLTTILFELNARF